MPVQARLKTKKRYKLFPVRNLRFYEKQKVLLRISRTLQTKRGVPATPP